MRHSVRRLALASVVALALTSACGADQAEPEDTAAAPAGGGAMFDALPQSVRDSKVLRFAGDSHPPYRVVGSDGSITGVERTCRTPWARCSASASRRPSSTASRLPCKAHRATATTASTAR